MPSLALEVGATVFVTGVNGLIGSHVVDQLLKRGYHVRGAVRNAEKHKYLTEYFSEKHKNVNFELVNVPDMTIEGCYDDFMQALISGIDGFIHVAAPISENSNLDLAVSIANNGVINALKACSKIPSCKRFVFTSSSIAAIFPRPNEEISLEESTYNEEALKVLDPNNPNKGGLRVYGAMKTASEKAAAKWVDENKPGFVFNSVLPNVNFGAVLLPQHQGLPSTIQWAHIAWTGQNTEMFKGFAGPQWYVNTVDCALIHVAALIYSDVESERLFAFAEPWSYNKVMGIWRKMYPERKFPEDIEGLGEDRMRVPNQRAEELLRRVKGDGWESLKMSLKEMSELWE
ncbi:uncharacterized protein yc1106_01172 [Curvularia clavata]|uniref:NAD-dependent epimerase/dehydratase domain-containing protein n=1 Tax=Curvularia clavata TaxID=95742 RepID=A0A9Q9DNG5_CURCL|nr:uncharacterized protein yc1106_01172 [Curvularia clavata]